MQEPEKFADSESYEILCSYWKVILPCQVTCLSVRNVFSDDLIFQASIDSIKGNQEDCLYVLFFAPFKYNVEYYYSDSSKAMGIGYSCTFRAKKDYSSMVLQWSWQVRLMCIKFPQNCNYAHEKHLQSIGEWINWIVVLNSSKKLLCSTMLIIDQKCKFLERISALPFRTSSLGM